MLLRLLYGPNRCKRSPDDPGTLSLAECEIGSISIASARLSTCRWLAANNENNGHTADRAQRTVLTWGEPEGGCYASATAPSAVTAV